MPKLSKKKQALVMVFGVFDRFHPGHQSFLRQAATYGRVIAVVARDSSVKKIKGRIPRERQRTRLRRLRNLPYISRAVSGDVRQGTYAVIKKYRPQVICFGYDQNLLKKDVIRKVMRKSPLPIRLIKLVPYRPDKFHTSLQK